MVLKTPEAGEVIRYAYLWWSEARRGRSEGLKDRPCAVVLTRTTADAAHWIYALPVTHSDPQSPEAGVAIPPATKQRLGLDAAPSWIVTTELNRFIWPGPDIRPLPTGEYSYGLLPGKLLRVVLDQVAIHAKRAALWNVNREPSE
jgi:hypothetical protein